LKLKHNKHTKLYTSSSTLLCRQ